MRVEVLSQPELFPRKLTPEGLRYSPQLIDDAEAAALHEQVAQLPFAPFEFHGHLANRRVVSFGLRYDYALGQVISATPVPEWLAALGQKAAVFADEPAGSLVQVLINEYRPGAGIGWHRDKPQFGKVVGVSLLAPCALRFRRKRGAIWDRVSTTLAPCSAYLLAGASRTVWEHSIPAVREHRYSITFRTLAI